MAIRLERTSEGREDPRRINGRDRALHNQQQTTQGLAVVTHEIWRDPWEKGRHFRKDESVGRKNWERRRRVDPFLPFSFFLLKVFFNNILGSREENTLPDTHWSTFFTEDVFRSFWALYLWLINLSSFSKNRG